MAKFEFDPSAMTGMLGSLSQTLSEAEIRADLTGDSRAVDMVRQLKGDLGDQYLSWLKLDHVELTLSPELLKVYVSLYGDLKNTVDAFSAPTHVLPERFGDLYEILERSNRFLIALPDDPKTPPPKPKPRPSRD